MNSNPEEIKKLLDEMEMSSKALTKEIADICWYMRGSVSWNEAWGLSPDQRRIIIKLIENNIERTEKAKMPLL